MWEWFLNPLIAAGFLFVAWRVHGSSGKRGGRFTKPGGLVLAFIAGLAFIVTIIGEMLSGWIKASLVAGVVGLGICAVIIAIDWGVDGRPDKPAFYAMFLLPLFIVGGWAQIPTAADQVKHGGTQVTSQFQQQHGKPASHSSKKSGK